MALELRQQLKLTQQLIMTPQLQMAVTKIHEFAELIHEMAGELDEPHQEV